MSTELITTVQEMLKEETWTRATISNYTKNNLTELTTLISFARAAIIASLIIEPVVTIRVLFFKVSSSNMTESEGEYSDASIKIPFPFSSGIE